MPVIAYKHISFGASVASNYLYDYNPSFAVYTALPNTYYKGPELDYRYYELTTGTPQNMTYQVHQSGNAYFKSGTVGGTFNYTAGGSTQVFDLSLGSVQHTVSSAGTVNGQMYVERV